MLNRDKENDVKTYSIEEYGFRILTCYLSSRRRRGYKDCIKELVCLWSFFGKKHTFHDLPEGIPAVWNGTEIRNAEWERHGLLRHGSIITLNEVECTRAVAYQVRSEL